MRNLFRCGFFATPPEFSRCQPRGHCPALTPPAACWSRWFRPEPPAAVWGVAILIGLLHPGAGVTPHPLTLC
eukprot:2942251-Prymnesium_polylepis.1